MKVGYERIANAALAVGIASALLFEYAGSLRFLVGGVGATAGIVSIINYLQHQFAIIDRKKKMQTEEAEATQREFIGANSSIQIIENSPIQITQDESNYISN